MIELLKQVRKCTLCLPHLPEGVNPILSVHEESKIAIIGQAPGRIVHKSGKPWADKSGDRLREWLNVEEEQFYNPKYFAIIPMGFCYPGKGKSGDLPPRPECAPKWHEKLIRKMPNLKLVLLIGAYAQSYYLEGRQQKNLTVTVKHYETYLPRYFVLPHPSPRNNIWMKKNDWFEKDVLPNLVSTVNLILNS